MLYQWTLILNKRIKQWINKSRIFICINHIGSSSTHIHRLRYSVFVRISFAGNNNQTTCQVSECQEGRKKKTHNEWTDPWKGKLLSEIYSIDHLLRVEVINYMQNFQVINQNLRIIDCYDSAKNSFFLFLQASHCQQLKETNCTSELVLPIIKWVKNSHRARGNFGFQNHHLNVQIPEKNCLFRLP